MGSINKRGKKYYARIRLTHNYITYNENKSFSTKLEASIWVQQREKAILEGADKDYDEDKTLGDAMKRYLSEVTPTKKGKKNEAHRIKAIMQQDYFPKSVPLMKLKPKMIVEWRDQRPISDQSKNRELSLIRSVVETARRDWNWTNHNPLIELKALKEPPHRNRRISMDEEELLLQYFKFSEEKPILQKQVVGFIFLIALETAMRQSEITNLDWRNVKLQEKYIRLLDTKNGDNRDVPLSKRAVELFKLLEHKTTGTVFNITSDSVSQTFRQATRALDVKDLRFHDTRHEACTRLARKLQVLDLAKMTGHKDTRSLMIYYNPTATEIADRLG